jgi:MraZ protein
MFRGESILLLDGKGRLTVPARYRETLLAHGGGKLVVTRDLMSPCLLMFPLAEWERVEAQLSALPAFKPATRRIQQLLLGNAQDLEMDGAGRVVLPVNLRDKADIDKSAALIGQGRRFELWNEARWREIDSAPFNPEEDLPPELEGFTL